MPVSLGRCWNSRCLNCDRLGKGRPLPAVKEHMPIRSFFLIENERRSRSIPPNDATRSRSTFLFHSRKIERFIQAAICLLSVTILPIESSRGDFLAFFGAGKYFCNDLGIICGALTLEFNYF